jgi:hypothetical protein
MRYHYTSVILFKTKKAIPNAGGGVEKLDHLLLVAT